MSPVERTILVTLVLFAYLLVCGYAFWRHKSKHQGATVSNKAKVPLASGESSGDMPFLVAYASQSGTAEAIAKRSATYLAERFTPLLLPLNQVTNEVLANSQRAFFVVSTYGEGEPPDNAISFKRRYLQARSVKANPALDLAHLEFSVLALGDQMYDKFCAFGHQVYQGLCQLGATPLIPTLEACATAQAAESIPYEPFIDKWRASVGISDVKLTEDSAVQTNSSTWQLAHRELLNPNSSGAPLYKIGLVATDNPSLTWQAGDLVDIHFEQTELQSTSQGIATTNHKRKYSIASIPEDGRIELIVRQQFAPDGELGIGSGALTQGLDLLSTLTLDLVSNKSFHGPALKRPMILIGSGSGLAGLRSHLKARAVIQASKNWLIYGERQRQFDNILDSEMQDLKSSGALERVDRVFSRDGNQQKYVQDCLMANANDVNNWVQQGAAIYVCGSLTGMAKGVDDALQTILGNELYQQVREQGLYRRDVY
ncbi:sulfite reductase subunit alpha [Paraglaciecola sp. 2405UD69-4]|uniref:sulfite reductase subunit alpha n=1 Tax=Paraglaciecola sp. 2405UD69-4 TaxID=3391836 RepID=UPI0039C8CE54